MSKRLPKVKLGELCRMVKGTSPTLKTEPGPYPLVVTAAYRRTADTWQLEGPAVCIPLVSSTGHGDAALHRVHYQDGKFALANLLVALLPHDRSVCDAQYLYHLLMTQKDELLVPLMQGTANVSLKEQDIAGVEIPLPPLAEQRRVVARIEELAAQIHAARTLRHQAAEEAEALVSSRLNEFIVTALSNRVPTRPVGSFTRFDRYGPRFYDQGYSEMGTPIVRATDIDDHGRIDFSTMPKLEVPPGVVKKLKAEVGDLLVVRSGSIGLSAVFSRPDVSCIPAAYLIQFRFDESADPHFVRYCLQAPSIQQELVGRGTTVQNLNAKKIKSTFIPFPPLPEQRRIVAELDALQAEVDALKRLQAETSTELDALLPSILNRAFRGEL